MSRPAGILDVDHVLNVIQRRCGDLGVNVHFDMHAKTACTDGRTITLPYVNHPITQSALDRLYGFVIHECGHHLRPKAFDILNAAQPPQHLQALYNIVEDDGMERERAEAWLGDRKALGIMNDDILREVASQWQAMLGIKIADEQDPAPLAALALGQMSRLNWDEYSLGSVTSMVRNFPKPVKELIGELEDEGWVRRFQGTTNETDTWDLAVDLAARLYPDNDKDEYEEIRKAGLAGAKGDKERRDTSKDTMVDSVALTVGEGDEKGDEEATPEGSTKVVSWRDVVISEHEVNKNSAPGGVAIDWSGYSDKSKAFVMPTSQINVVDLGKSKSKTTDEEPRGYYDRGRSTTQYMPTDKASKQFANRIRRYVQSLARSTVDRDKYHGKLDRGSIVKLALPPIDGGDYNKRIFYDQRKHTIKDTAIFVLADWSGSMIGNKMKYAADASQRLVHTFERILNIPVALAAFTEGKTRCDIGYVKPFNTRGMSAYEIAVRFAKFYSYTSGNNDSDAVHWAWQQILKRKESRKILIVLSDGAPTDSWKGHAHTNLQFVTKQIEQDGRVELYGVGICSDAVRNYYTNHRVLHEADEINNTLFALIKDGYHDYKKRR